MEIQVTGEENDLDMDFYWIYNFHKSVKVMYKWNTLDLIQNTDGNLCHKEYYKSGTNKILKNLNKDRNILKILPRRGVNIQDILNDIPYIKEPLVLENEIRSVLWSLPVAGY